jgi:hypothetical protein
MIGISKGMVAVAALVAFGLVTVDDMAKGLAQPAQALTQTEDAEHDDMVVRNAVLRERAATALRTLTEKQEAAPKAAEPAEQSRCRDQVWPYYSNACLVRRDGTEPKVAIRVVQLDRLDGEAVRPRRLQ